MERLQKIISSVGIASRRKAEAMILQGRVTVNGSVVTQLGSKADLRVDHIKVDGKLLRPPGARIYILLNKPRQVVSTAHDPQGRVKVTDLVRVRERVYPVGRLDYQTEGLILLTNDGEFTRIVSRAGDAVPKVYHVKVKGTVEETLLRRLRKGGKLSDGTALQSSRIRLLREGNNSWYEVTLTQGKNLQIRKMFGSAGHPVLKLRRVSIGFLKMNRLPVGGSRPLTQAEVSRFLALGRRRH